MATKLHLHYRAQFDGDQAAIDARPRLGDLDCFVIGSGLEHRVSAEHFLRLDERTVGHAASSDRPGRLRSLELLAPVGEDAGGAVLLVPREDLRVPGLLLLGGELTLRLGIQYEHYVFHAGSFLASALVPSAPPS